MNEYIEEMRNLKEQEKPKRVGFNKFFFDWIIPIALAVILAQLIIHFVMFKVEVPTPSMAPTVNPNDQFFVTKVYNPENLKRGDIIVFKSEESTDLLFKRLIGLPGDKIDIREGGKVFINDKEYKEDYVKNPSNDQGSFAVPKGKYFMLGDNRADSKDARFWKNPYIDGSAIQAKAQIRIYPFDKIGFIK